MMLQIDVRTILFMLVLASALGVVVMFLLWLQNRKRFPEIALWLLDYCMQLAATLFIALRGIVPDLASIVAANVLIIGGTIALLGGLQRFVGVAVRQAHNHVMLGGFTLIHAYFTYVHPSLEARNINLSIALGALCAQGSWLMLRQVATRLRPATRATGVVLAGFCAVALIQLVGNLVRPPGNDLMHSGSMAAYLLVAEQTLFLGLTFALFLLVSRRLRGDVEHELEQRLRIELHLRESEERFARAFQTSPYAIAITRLDDGRIVEVNDAFVAISGYSRAELVAQSSLGLNLWVHESDRHEMTATLRQGGAVEGREYQFRGRNGRIITGLFSARTIELRRGPCLLSSIQDITERKQADLELRQHRHFLAELIEHSGALICTKNKDGCYELVNRKWEETTGIPREQALGKTDESLFPGEVGRLFRVNDLQVLESGAALETEETLETGGVKKWLLSVKFPVRSGDGGISGVCSMITDITERKQAEERIRHLATHDHLTGLPTQRLARDRLGTAIRIARREKRAACAMFIDLDGFKAVNDTYGHEAGDCLLRELARRMASRIRESDTVARIGGDEFLLVASGIRSGDDAMLIANKVLEELSRPIVVNGFEMRVSASIGIALYPQHGSQIDELIKVADHAMYCVKRSSRNGIGMAATGT